MPVFYKVLICGICLLSMGLWFLYDAIKRPLKSKDGYDSNLMEFIRAIGLIVLGILTLGLLFFVKKF